ncbi:unnamed protein product [Prorocentrum cordatum]|uniref:Mei2-like C-terminal RNA recognition motif domain-containing protein n=1 Tax=Prorocentrum cordatum TaxID=2364126 RepID=A0ABN9RJ47_9DINO|nr:unnamed protein product [Polarella glacialis]
MAPAITSFASSYDRPLSTPGCGAGFGAQDRGGLRRVQSAPVLFPEPVVLCPVCPALAWADMLELDFLLPDDSPSSSSDDGLSAVLAGLDVGRPSTIGSRQHSPVAVCTPLGLPFESPFDALPLKVLATSDRAVNCTRTPLSTKARPFVAAGAAAAETLLQRGPDGGFAKKYDFVYIPTDFETTRTRGFSFVNLTSPSHVKPFFETFDGFFDWQCQACRKECQVCRSETQTLQSNILRYKDSTIMDPSVPDEYKPIILKDGVRIQFPQPTRECRKIGKSFGTRKGCRRTMNVAFRATRDLCM